MNNCTVNYKYLNFYKRFGNITVCFEDELSFLDGEGLTFTTGVVCILLGDQELTFYFNCFLWVDDFGALKIEVDTDACKVLNSEGGELDRSEIEALFEENGVLRIEDFEASFTDYIHETIRENAEKIQPFLIINAFGIPHDSSVETLYNELEANPQYAPLWWKMRAWLGEETAKKLNNAIINATDNEKKALINWLRDRAHEVI